MVEVYLLSLKNKWWLIYCGSEKMSHLFLFDEIYYSYTYSSDGFYDEIYWLYPLLLD
jgi:hypothetical protein